MPNTEKDMNIEGDIRSLIADILKESPETIEADAHFIKDLGMDSMMTLEVFAGIEKKYRIVIPEETLPTLRDLNTTARAVTGIINNKRN